MTIKAGMIDSGEMTYILSTLEVSGYLTRGEYDHDPYGSTVYIKAYPNQQIPIGYHQFIFCYLLPIFHAIDYELTISVISSFYRNEFDIESKEGHSLYKMILTLIDLITI